MHEASAVLDQLLSEVKAKFASSHQQQGMLDAIRAFTAAVDWKVCPCQHSIRTPVYTHDHTADMWCAQQEPWLLTVLFTQLALFLSILFLRKNTSYLTSIFLLASKST